MLNILNSEAKKVRIVNSELNGEDKKFFYKLFNSINIKNKNKKN